jgi:hypothetical protein
LVVGLSVNGLAPQQPALARAASGVRLSEFRAIVQRAKLKARAKPNSRVVGRVERGLAERVCASKPKSVALEASVVDSQGVGGMFNASPNANPILVRLLPTPRFQGCVFM